MQRCCCIVQPFRVEAQFLHVWLATWMPFIRGMLSIPLLKEKCHHVGHAGTPVESVDSRGMHGTSLIYNLQS